VEDPINPDAVDEATPELIGATVVCEPYGKVLEILGPTAVEELKLGKVIEEVDAMIPLEPPELSGPTVGDEIGTLPVPVGPTVKVELLDVGYGADDDSEEEPTPPETVDEVTRPPGTLELKPMLPVPDGPAVELGAV
jgi:hypothetical protein